MGELRILAGRPFWGRYDFFPVAPSRSLRAPDASVPPALPRPVPWFPETDASLPIFYISPQGGLIGTHYVLGFSTVLLGFGIGLYLDFNIIVLGLYCGFIAILTRVLNQI